MKFRYLVVAALLGALCAFGVTVALGASKEGSPGALYAFATGKKEVSPTTGKKGAGDRNGRAGFTAVIDGTEFCWGIAAKNVDGTPSGAHIHKGRPSRNGPIVIALDPPASIDPGASSGARRLTPIWHARSRRTRASTTSTSIRPPTSPNGAVRGQLFGKRRWLASNRHSRRTPTRRECRWPLASFSTRRLSLCARHWQRPRRDRQDTHSTMR